MKNRKWIARCFIGIIAVFFVCNAGLVTDLVGDYYSDEITFSEFRDEVKEELESSEFSFKEQFVNFNGWFSRLLGKQVVNEVAFAENGILISANIPKNDMGFHGVKVAEFDAALRQMNIPFVFVLAPSKSDLEGKVVPAGAVNHYNDNADRLLAELGARNVQSMDLRPQFSATIEDVAKNFYKTDHHWNYTAAFDAFRTVSSMIQETLEDETDTSFYTDIANWEKHVYPEGQFGSYGKRVGSWAVKSDDFEYYLPGFETDMTIAYVQEEREYSGDFTECIIRNRTHGYYMFIGSDSGLVQHRNKLPVIKKKILLLKDSFVLPLQSYLSTVYEAVDVIDPRAYYKGSIIQYVAETKPDMVMMIHNPTQIERIAEYNFIYNEDD